MRINSPARRTKGLAPAESLDEILGIRARMPDVMPNKAALTNTMALVRYEALVTSVTIPFALTRLRPNRKPWSLKHWRLAHRTIFKPVYEWAGELRTVNIKKEDAFVDKDRIEVKVKEIFAQFYKMNAPSGNLVDGLGHLGVEQLAEKFAHLYSDLNFVHPFREGNGRSLKVLMTAMVRQVGTT